MAHTIEANTIQLNPKVRPTWWSYLMTLTVPSQATFSGSRAVSHCNKMLTALICDPTQYSSPRPGVWGWCRVSPRCACTPHSWRWWQGSPAQQRWSHTGSSSAPSCSGWNNTQMTTYLENSQPKLRWHSYNVHPRPQTSLTQKSFFKHVHHHKRVTLRNFCLLCILISLHSIIIGQCDISKVE